MAELDQVPAPACCSPEAQATCCAPADKATCCGDSTSDSTCGCSAEKKNPA